MRIEGGFLRRRLTCRTFDLSVVRVSCHLASVVVIPLAIVALLRHPGTRAEFLLGLGLAFLLSLLILMLGTLTRHNASTSEKVSIRCRRAELAGYVGCPAMLIAGLQLLSRRVLTPVQATLGVLLVCTLSLTLLILGMLSTAVRDKPHLD